MIQNIGDGIANLTHRILQRTVGLGRVGTVAALLIGGFAHTGNRCEWPVQDTDHLTQSYLVGRLDQPVAAFDASTTSEQPGPFQREKNLLKELNRDMLALGNLMSL
jgi:hypothetical protein